MFAATVGLVQNDIKRIIAYSTCSQLGYMFVAMGVGAYSVGMYHLFTHAFFKALLFLGSGSVIIAAAYAGKNPAALYAYLMTLGAAALTAFYSWRLIYKTFHGQPHDEARHEA